jgi:hypothetical protein
MEVPVQEAMSISEEEVKELEAAYQIKKWSHYAEKEVAHMLKVDPSTLKRWRYKGKVPFIEWGDREIHYRGIDIMRIVTQGVKGD